VNEDVDFTDQRLVIFPLAQLRCILFCSVSSWMEWVYIIKIYYIWSRLARPRARLSGARLSYRSKQGDQVIKYCYLNVLNIATWVDHWYYITIVAYGRLVIGVFLSRVSILTCDIDIANLSVRPSVCPLRSGIRWNRLNISSQFFHYTVAQSF